MEVFGMKTMKRMLLALLLALGPACAHAASILWVSIDPDASVKNPDGAILSESLRQFQLDGRPVNAAKVSASDGIGSTSYLLIAYDDLVGNIVVDDPESNTIDLSALSGSSGGDGGGSGSGGDTESAGGWIAVSLGDLIQTANLDSTTITLELGYVDWYAYDNSYNPNDPGTWEVSFTRMAVATGSLGELAEAPYIFQQNDLSKPDATPWTPDSFTAVPEPSVCLTALFGVLLLSKRRRPRRAVTGR